MSEVPDHLIEKAAGAMAERRKIAASLAHNGWHDAAAHVREGVRDAS